jgi:hypothetical protein
MDRFWVRVIFQQVDWWIDLASQLGAQSKWRSDGTTHQAMAADV